MLRLFVPPWLTPILFTTAYDELTPAEAVKPAAVVIAPVTFSAPSNVARPTTLRTPDPEISPATANLEPSNVRFASPFKASPELNVATLLSAPLATAQTAPLPPANKLVAVPAESLKNSFVVPLSSAT